MRKIKRPAFLPFFRKVADRVEIYLYVDIYVRTSPGIPLDYRMQLEFIFSPRYLFSLFKESLGTIKKPSPPFSEACPVAMTRLMNFSMYLNPRGNILWVNLQIRIYEPLRVAPVEPACAHTAVAVCAPRQRPRRTRTTSTPHLPARALPRANSPSFSTWRTNPLDLPRTIKWIQMVLTLSRSSVPSLQYVL